MLVIHILKALIFGFGPRAEKLIMQELDPRSLSGELLRKRRGRGKGGGG